ncbi:Prolyl 4-hydroxylase subunit alpha-3 [Folsomia candida]|uniref:Prolyl 4-hydroxylase subunit alpha-3 n=1 Tax=Folsomia candida TaxID=158441 RepID=A0A226DFA2_FOLCA|nr:Prolyl 4-hydroxylase subunit alpha-3 [Folsomia candida]
MEEKLMKTMIKIHYENLHKIDNTIKQTNTTIREKTPELWSEIRNLINKTKEITNINLKAKHITKLNQLVQNNGTNTPTKSIQIQQSSTTAIENRSTHKFSDSEMNLLKLGLNFSMKTRDLRLPLIETAAAVEMRMMNETEEVLPEYLKNNVRADFVTLMDDMSDKIRIPNSEDVDGAVDGILRIQSTYGDSIQQFFKVTMGGGMAFPRVGVATPAVRRSAAFWYNLKKNGQPDPLSLHGGCPLVNGSNGRLEVISEEVEDLDQKVLGLMLDGPCTEEEYENEKTTIIGYKDKISRARIRAGRILNKTPSPPPSSAGDLSQQRPSSDSGNQSVVNQASTETSSYQSSIQCDGEVLLKTVLVRVRNNKESRIVRLLFDEGSQKSYVTSYISNGIKSKPVGDEVVRNVMIDGSVTSPRRYNKHEMELVSVDGKVNRKLLLRERPQIGGIPPRARLWDLETIGIQESATKVSREENDLQVKETFQKKVTRDEDGRYVVKLPWIHDDLKFTIPDNKSVYNCVLSFNHKEDYMAFKESSVEIMADAKMELRQWESNADELIEGSYITTVLGLKWDKKEDVLFCQLPKEVAEEYKITKRRVLSVVSQIFEPIGYACPSLLLPKLMLQEAWSRDLGWDDEWMKKTGSDLKLGSQRLTA